MLFRHARSTHHEMNAPAARLIVSIDYRQPQGPVEATFDQARTDYNLFQSRMGPTGAAEASYPAEPVRQHLSKTLYSPQSSAAADASLEDWRLLPSTSKARRAKYVGKPRKLTISAKKSDNLLPARPSHKSRDFRIISQSRH